MIAEELLKRDLPDLFRFRDGRAVSSVSDWEDRRKELTDLLLSEEYGYLPPALTPRVTVSENRVDFAGKATWQTLQFTFSHAKKSHTVPVQMIYPKKGKRHPFFLMLNFRPDIPDRYLPVEELIDHGFGIASFCYLDVSSDDGDFTGGLSGLFSDGKRGDTSFGKISLWAYMAMRVVDYLMTREEVDMHRLAVTGHSRLGKTALLAGALDPRICAVFSNGSGCSGAALSRMTCADGETTAIICERFPHWFSPRYQTYAVAPDRLPFDQHALLALIAPRVVGIGAASLDVWADTDGQFLSCAAASPVWELYGEDGLLTPDRLPQIGDEHTGGRVGFHLREGKHYFSRTDWLVYMRTMKKLFGELCDASDACSCPFR